MHLDLFRFINGARTAWIVNRRAGHKLYLFRHSASQSLKTSFPTVFGLGFTAETESTQAVFHGLGFRGLGLIRNITGH